MVDLQVPLHKLSDLAITHLGIPPHDPEGGVADAYNHVLKINMRYASNFIEVEKTKQKS